MGPEIKSILKDMPTDSESILEAIRELQETLPMDSYIALFNNKQHISGLKSERDGQQLMIYLLVPDNSIKGLMLSEIMRDNCEEWNFTPKDAIPGKVLFEYKFKA